MGNCDSDFSVTINKRGVVAAVLPFQEHRLTLSNLDLLLPALDVGVFFCYKKPNNQNVHLDHFSSMVGKLKSSLAKVIDSYYVFSGKVVTNTCGEPEVLLCNNCGVDFVEAYGDVELRQLNFYNPDSSVEGKFLPKKKDGVLAVQVTELKCGGVIFGCTFDHRIADAYSANMFLLAWSAMATSLSSSSSPSHSNLPIFHHSLLNPRRLISHNPSMDQFYVPITSLPPPKPSHHPGTDHTTSRIYYVTADDITRIQARATAGRRSRTKLESFTAFLWQLSARSSSSASERCKMGVVVDGRTRLAPDGALACYFGNVLSVPFGVVTAGELAARPLSWVADRVHQFLSAVATREHFLDLIDWVEARRPEAAVARAFCKEEGEGPVVVVSGGMRFPVGEVEFGWGKAVLGSYYFPCGGESGYVMPVPSAKGNGDWLVYVLLMNKLLPVLEAEAAGFFRPLMAEYLGLNYSQ